MKKTVVRWLGPELAANAEVERLYYPSPTGYLFATNHLTQRLQLPFYGMVILSIDGKPIRISSQNEEYEHTALALWAQDVRFLDVRSRFAVIAVNPFHPLFRAFTKIPGTGVLKLEYADYSEFIDLARKALDNARFTHAEALALHRGVMRVVHDTLPKVPALDQRAQTLMKLLCDEPRSLLASLADGLNLSYHRTSHLFAHTVGISMRTYQLWQKLYLAGEPLMRGASLTEAAHSAGFVDSAHYSKAFQTAYGRSPTDMFRRRRVVVFFRNAFTEATIGESIRLVRTG
ncbi:MAG TPA: helix-turn-helix domain-containing protein [Steroidobacteraceae bacterium]|nr:helix-turn-helix domain-containing protein [Steroidobacteraceae bacterium]